MSAVLDSDLLIWAVRGSAAALAWHAFHLSSIKSEPERPQIGTVEVKGRTERVPLMSAPLLGS